MPYYYQLKRLPTSQRKRAVQGLKRLRQQLDDEIPVKTRNETLVIGTWNIRNFDDDRFGYGKRSVEDLHYIAEIISRFDVIAVQEICRDLGPLDDVMRILGNRDYDYIVSDPSEGAGGNDERLGFIFDKSKVWFQGVAGEIVLPPKMELSVVAKKRQFSRTPFMCSFQSGWFKFMFSTVHIYFGKDSGKKYEARVAEIDAVAKFLAKRAKEDGEQNQVLVGDFNIKKGGSKGHNALKGHGFDIVQNRKGSNAKQTKFYDQISFLERDGEVRIKEQNSNGTLQFFDSIFRPEDFARYRPELRDNIEGRIKDQEAAKKKAQSSAAKATTAKSKANWLKKVQRAKDNIADYRAHLTGSVAADKKLQNYYVNEWRTFHASDHLPLWVELEIDFSADYLNTIAKA